MFHFGSNYCSATPETGRITLNFVNFQIEDFVVIHPQGKAYDLKLNGKEAHNTQSPYYCPRIVGNVN